MTFSNPLSKNSNPQLQSLFKLVPFTSNTLFIMYKFNTLNVKKRKEKNAGNIFCFNVTAADQKLHI